MYNLRPHAAGILYAPPFYTPPTPRRAFSGVRGWGCTKFGPVFLKKMKNISEIVKIVARREKLDIIDQKLDKMSSFELET